jgi:hypothetical protein
MQARIENELVGLIQYQPPPNVTYPKHINLYKYLDCKKH